MKRTLAIGDIHGGLKGLKQLLARIDSKEDDQLIFLGDYVDGWSESAQVIQYLMEFSKRQECIFIKGNHDVWCEDWLREEKAPAVWQQHGGKGTIASYKDFSKSEKKAHLKFFEAMPLFHIDDQDRLFIHAGFTSMHGVAHETYEENFYFDRTLWEMALVADRFVQKNAFNYPNRLKHYHEIFIGHTPTLNFNETEPMKALNVWNVDTGAAFTGPLSAIDIDSKTVIQSDTVQSLYPYEKGRNKN
ncbi:serine/threonine protein phosphatase [Subsaximicrobium wynnwilliamsii]|uniref:Serine/threonine protein phosphatase n=1 Tax=Subsaximicrobium wynnwilliamsii TaxID=291179 RepID=A0A5C6ZJG8_9FLAO|nr:metallophosphoesterase family protein [Subsaximicrobium wynnwilliamsii]TXD83523.1 serine/threonine protein phosphatase [Subsaximicrobium wynnwilliamsii]TXD89202.1 serine/threonine protein phosphatase [Subsaximicrobium wynnwilliamsii]TXE03203.1 serine/threonine protein phosphatase [Subsaximicrobium wynnwilliamsii]